MKDSLQFRIFNQDDLYKLSEVDFNCREVHIWIINWKSIQSWIKNYRGILTEKERESSRAYYFKEDRSRGETGKILTRLLAAHYLQISYTQIMVIANSYGKPIIYSTDGELINHNVSHSGDYVVLAFSLQGTIGVDIEKMRTLPEYQEIASSFHRNEYLKICNKKSLKVFYRIWTAKEAYVKAKGVGLNIDLESFEIRDSVIYRNSIPQKQWEIFYYTIQNTYSGAVVVLKGE